MQSLLRWTALAAGVATAALANFEAAHPIEHAAWFLGGAVWSLCCVLIFMVVRYYPDRNALSPEERQQQQDDMSI